MNQAIANIIKKHISGLDFVDKIAGLVSACTFDIVVRDKENNPTTVQKTFPIACCLTEKCTIETAYQDLMPNSDYKTVIYFEDKGVSWVKTEGRYKHYTSNVRLVCWINVAKILGDTCKEGDTCTLSTHLITEIIRSLPEFPGHHNPFNMVFSEVIDQEVRSPSIFSTYTYDEKHSQYLMYPYDYFALDIQTSFAICMKGTQVYNADCSSTDLDNLDIPVATEATNISVNSFTANWETVDGATGYAIDVATDPGLTDFVLQDARVGNVLSVLVSNLDSDATYYYQVRAYNDYTESESSNTINLTTSQSGQTTFNDYFLGSKDEKNAMYAELYLYGVGNFTEDEYWSSSEYDNTGTWLQAFGDGTQGTDFKTALIAVRACRAFTSTTNYNLRDIGPAGGYVFWKSGNDYLEAAPSDQSISQSWSNIINVEIGITAQGTAIGTGQSNTIAIINQVVLGSELITGWTNQGGSWDTFTSSDKDITLAIKPDSDTANCFSDTITFPPSVLRLTINLTLNSGVVPFLRCNFLRGGMLYYNDLDVLVAGINIIDYVVIAGDTDINFHLQNIAVHTTSPYFTNVNCNFSAEFSVKELIGIHTDSAAKLCDDLIVTVP